MAARLRWVGGPFGIRVAGAVRVRFGGTPRGGRGAAPPRFATAAEALHTVFGYDAVPRRAGRDHRPGRRAAATRSCSCRPAAARASATRSPRSCARARASSCQPAHRAHARPGRRARAQRRARRLPQLEPAGARARRGRARLPRRRARPALRRARAAQQRVDQALPRSAARSRSSRSTRRTACRSGATTSGPTTSRSASSPSACPTCRASPSPPRRPRRRIARSPSGCSLDGAQHFVSSFDRPNIQYRIEPKVELRKQLLDFVRSEGVDAAGTPVSGIVYALCAREHRADRRVPRTPTASTRCRTTRASTPGVRAAHQARFLREDGVVDGRDDRVRHGHRQARRALRRPHRPAEVGRGLLPGDRPRRPRRRRRPTAWMAYGLQDVVQQRRMIDQSPGDLAHRRRLAQHLDAMLALCETVQCRRQNLLGYFGEASEPCGNCDTCLEPPETWDGTVPAQKLMSTIVRLQRERGQAFGAGHLIDILRGKETAARPPARPRRAGDLGHRRRPHRAGVARRRAAAPRAGPARHARRVRHAHRHAMPRPRCSRDAAQVMLRAEPERAARARGAASRAGRRRPRAGAGRALRGAARVARRRGARAGRARLHRLRRRDAARRRRRAARRASPTSTASPASARRSARPTARRCSRWSRRPSRPHAWLVLFRGIARAVPSARDTLQPLLTTEGNQTMASSRPGGVTLVAVLTWISGAIYIIVGGLGLFPGGQDFWTLSAADRARHRRGLRRRRTAAGQQPLAHHHHHRAGDRGRRGSRRSLHRAELAGRVAASFPRRLILLWSGRANDFFKD